MQVVLLSEDEERVMLGLNMALTAVASGVQVSAFFALGAARWVCAKHEAEDAVTRALEKLVAGGVRLYCCSTCAQKHCTSEGGEPELVDGVRNAGLASLIHQVVGGTQTVTI